VLNELPEDFNALWLGGRLFGNRAHYSERLYKVTGITGLYGYLVRSEYIPVLLTALAKENKIADIAISSVLTGAYKTKVNLVKHRDGVSTIKGKFVSYPDLK
jgi:hypothetical protein